jgi:hypothetical protein
VEFSKVAEHKMNMQKSLAFLYIKNEQSKCNIKKTVIFAIALEYIKYLGISLVKEVKDLYTKNKGNIKLQTCSAKEKN